MKSLWMLSASFFFSLMAVFVKMGASDFGSLELIFYRSIAGVALLYTFIRMKGYSIKTPHLWGHFKRSFIGTVSMSIWFFSLTMLPIGTSMTLNYTSPLFMALFVFIVSLYRKEPTQWGLMATIALGFLGVILVFQPSLGAGQEFGALLALTSGFLGSIAYWQIKELGQLKEPSWRIVFYFTTFGTVFGLLGSFVIEDGMHMPTLESGAYLVGMGICATLAQICTTRSYAYGNMLLSSCLGFSAIPFSACMSFIFFAEYISWNGLIGMIMIVIAGIFATIYTKKTEAQAKADKKAAA